jgi:hypothetical protein
VSLTVAHPIRPKQGIGARKSALALMDVTTTSCPAGAKAWPSREGRQPVRASFWQGRKLYLDPPDQKRLHHQRRAALNSVFVNWIASHG